MAPILVPANQPEDWVASTTCCFATAGIGYRQLQDGTVLTDAVSSKPEKWLGAEHLAKYGADTKLLVKLLDAGHRPPVQAHPHVDLFRQRRGRNHGKAEAWYPLTPGSVWLGLKESISHEEPLHVVETGRGRDLLDRMHKFDVLPHQALYVPPGTLHAIGEGIMVV
ncbi:hypothetical protein J3458_016159 [Metarhizium acridum]|uniref:Phosphomannose isomerase n=1 Tax=Metarhizium acridum (strain CQMa 102) TaxID=655827 RepID=E9EAV7_METAQ|nr:phosphomannose isomerase [Metarhizium acridum CQMa 102]EFY86991.1 phosphomannose isomerase [Metarhizium acridum CQMa 102]KAG8406181.1 hypothetical protein J3458_021508 [Metarhizium acridum]KAG8411048.1 hypothetical protein J3458_016159 [Metarhizium acridum]